MERGRGDRAIAGLLPGADQLPASVFYEDRLPEGTQYRCEVSGDGRYVMEAAIPNHYLQERQGDNWRSIRFNLVVQDRDSGEENWPRHTFMPDWRGDKNFVGSGMFFRD